MYLKSKSTVSEWVTDWVTRSPIELFWTAKNMNTAHLTMATTSDLLMVNILFRAELILYQELEATSLVLVKLFHSIYIFNYIVKIHKDICDVEQLSYFLVFKITVVLTPACDLIITPTFRRKNFCGKKINVHWGREIGKKQQWNTQEFALERLLSTILPIDTSPLHFIWNRIICLVNTWSFAFHLKKWPEELRRYAPTKV